MKWVFLVITVAMTTLCRAIPSKEQVEAAIDAAKQFNNIKRDFNQFYARSLDGSSQTGPQKCPMAKFHGRRSNTETEQDNVANDMLTAFQMLKHQGFSQRELTSDSVTSIFLRQTPDCDVTPSCSLDEKYRSIDGTCNNLNNPTWGQAGRPQLRLLPAAYDDGISTPRGFNGKLPNPRSVSNAVHSARVGPEVRSRDMTLHVFQMGQFLDHDLISTPTISVSGSCCDVTDDINRCFPIRFTNDSVFGKSYCMDFKRSSPDPCSAANSSREQINDLTSFIDASNVYGSSEAVLTSLRDGPFLKTAAGNRLPVGSDDHCIPNKTAGFMCSLAGDERVDTVPSLTAYHTLFVREHNRIATALSSFYADDETLFQETRKIIIAMMQKIVYDEFLPAFMSEEAIKKYRLSSDEPYIYDPTINPTISNAFGISYRMGHTWIPRDMSVFNKDLSPSRRFETNETYLRPDLTYFPGPPQGLEGLAYWLSGANSPETDSVVEDVARNRLFSDGVDAFDLVALNIQRGRDHGVPSFATYRKEYCNLTDDLSSWDTVPANVFSSAIVTELQDVGYASPMDVDLFTGNLVEVHPEGILGPTLECLLGIHFEKLKFGDRFWYQNKFQATAFKDDDQISEIQKTSLARLMCDNFNFDRINYPNAFLSSDPRTPCRNIPGINLTVFAPPASTTASPTTTNPPPTTRQPPPPPTTRRPPPPPTTRNPPPPPPKKPAPPPPNRPRDLTSLLEELIKELDSSD